MVSRARSPILFSWFCAGLMIQSLANKDCTRTKLRTNKYSATKIPGSVYLASSICSVRALSRAKVDGCVPHTHHVNLKKIRQPSPGRGREQTVSYSIPHVILHSRFYNLFLALNFIPRLLHFNPSQTLSPVVYSIHYFGSMTCLQTRTRAMHFFETVSYASSRLILYSPSYTLYPVLHSVH